MKKSVLLVSYHFLNEQDVGSGRMRGLAASLLASGCDVTVLCCKELGHRETPIPNYVVAVSNPMLLIMSLIFGGAGKPNPNREEGSSMRVTLASRMFRRTGAVLLGRMPDIADFWLAWVLLKRPFAGSWDVCVATYAPYANLAIGVWLKRSARIKMLNLDYRDPWSEHHLFRGIWPFSMVERKLERYFNSNADLISVVSAGLFNRVVHSNIHIVNNGFDGHVRIRDAKQPKTKFRLIHAGTCYLRGDKLTVFLEKLAKSLDDAHEDWEINFVGHVFFDVTKVVSDLNLHQKVFFFGKRCQEDLEDFIRQSDAGLSFDVGNENFRGVIPTKLATYVQYDLPIFQIVESREVEAVEYLAPYPKAVTATYSQLSYEREVTDLELLGRRATNCEILEAYSREKINLAWLQLLLK